MQEFLVVVVIALAVFFLPRVLGRRPEPKPASRPPALTGRMRLAILITVCWIAGSAVLLKPWQGDALLFLYFGLGPPAISWSAAWVWFGFRTDRR